MHRRRAWFRTRQPALAYKPRLGAGVAVRPIHRSEFYIRLFCQYLAISIISIYY